MHGRAGTRDLQGLPASVDPAARSQDRASRLRSQLSSNPRGVLKALKQRVGLAKNPPMATGQLLDRLAKAGAPEFAADVRRKLGPAALPNAQAPARGAAQRPSQLRLNLIEMRRRLRRSAVLFGSRLDQGDPCQYAGQVADGRVELADDGLVQSELIGACGTEV
jgi:hypothetical protein